MEIKIEHMVYKGDGLGRLPDGRVIFLPFTLPDEIAAFDELKERNGVLTAIPSELNNESPSRVDPKCPYFRLCGGCQYQHADYEFQLEIKKSILIEQLERFGGLKNLPVQNTIPSQTQFGYRNHVQFHLDPEGKPGFQKALSHEVIPVEKCLLVNDTINSLLSTLVFEPETGVTRVSIRDDGLGAPLMMLAGSTINPPEFEVDFPLNVVYRSDAGAMVLSGESFNQFEIYRKAFQVSAGSFFQTNSDMAAIMAKKVLAAADFPKDGIVLDAYCGVGFFSKFLAEKAGRLIGIESSEDACSDFAVNLDEFDNVELYQGNVEAILPELDIKPDLAVVDPPRAGIASPGMKALLKSTPAQIIYFSCDPSTLARDLKIMASSGYHIDSVTPLDMFPQTYHIESMSILRKEK